MKLKTLKKKKTIFNHPLIPLREAKAGKAGWQTFHHCLMYRLIMMKGKNKQKSLEQT